MCLKEVEMASFVGNIVQTRHAVKLMAMKLIMIHLFLKIHGPLGPTISHTEFVWALGLCNKNA
jgi:hypothetical protein